MTAAAARRELAALGRDLAQARGTISARRASALVGAAAPASGFADLALAPTWLRLPHEELARLARRVALQAMALPLAGAIDGALLGRIADECGEADVDAAIDLAEPGDDLPLIDCSVQEFGYALLAIATSPTLRGYLPPHRSTETDPARVARWIGRVAA